MANGFGALYSNTVGHRNMALGHFALYSNTSGNNNMAFGTEALKANTTGENNIALGTTSLTSNIGGNFNIGIGQKSLMTNTVGDSNIGIGSQALQNNISGSYNVGLGFDVLRFNTAGNYNVGLGLYALSKNTVGMSNVGLGHSALSNNTIGSHNVGLGTNALTKNTTGNYNVGIGNSTLTNNAAGMGNVAIGNLSLVSNNGGNYNVAVGNEALGANTSGAYNIALGTSALANNTTGQHNNAQGLNALQNNTVGNNNIALGNGSGGWVKGHNNIHIGSANFQSVSTGELDNVIAIGNGIGSSALTTANSNDNTIILGYQNGHAFSPNVGIGTYKPDSKVHIVTNGPNAIKIQDTNQGAGKVLTSDANGVGTWKEPAPPIADFTRQYARTAVNYDLQPATTQPIPGINDFIAPKTGKYLVLFHSFLQNAWETGTRNLYFIMLLNGAPWIDADETYSYVSAGDYFNQHYSNIIGLTAGDRVSFRVNANRGKLRFHPTWAPRNRIEVVYLGQ